MASEKMTDPTICGLCSISGTVGPSGLSAGVPIKLGSGNCQRCTEHRTLRPDATWPGTPHEMERWEDVMLRLMKQADPPCGCKYGAIGAGNTCSTHTDGMKDQRWLDGLVMMRREHQRLEAEEHSV